MREGEKEQDRLAVWSNKYIHVHVYVHVHAHACVYMHVHMQVGLPEGLCAAAEAGVVYSKHSQLV